MIVMMMLVMMMGVAIRTGGIAHHSTPRLTRVPAAVLAQHHTPPQVARQFPHLFGKRHGLIKIRQEIAKARSSRHPL
jgi:Skp family chaperone for outer membrane proteins